MADTRINFGALEQDRPWTENLLGTLVEGYKAGRLPAQMRQEEERQRLLAEQLGLANENQRTANEFQRPTLEQNLEMNRLNLEALPEQLALKKAESQVGIQESLERLKKLQYENSSESRERANLLAGLKLDAEKSLIDKRRADAQLAQSKVQGATLSARDKKFQEEAAKKDAIIYGNATEKIAASNDLKDLYNGIDSVLMNPDVKNAIGPLDKTMTNLAGFPQTRELAAQLDVYSKALTRQSLNLFKGATSDFELKYAESNFPKNSDTLSTYTGKMKALKNINDQIVRRNELVAKYTSEGYQGYIALQKAQDETPIIQPVETGNNQSGNTGSSNFAPGQFKGWVRKNG